MQLDELCARILPPDQAAAGRAKQRWDSIAKPLGSLGLLEDAVVRMAGIFGSDAVSIEKRGCIVMCADNGVVAQGVTQTGQEVTAVVTENFCSGQTSVCAMGRYARCDILPVDIGVASDVTGNGLTIHKILPGTADMTQGPAMAREQALDAILFGAEFAMRQAQAGYRIFATGEMGIGNTTTSSAILCALLQKEPEEIVGRGAGLSTEGLGRKIGAVRRALAVNRPDREDPVDVLYKVGGLDIAGLCGVFLGAAAARVPVLTDGLISCTAALLAKRLCPACAGYMIASHCSEEPASGLLLRELGLTAMITAGMRLGEGTGAVAALPLLDMALAVYHEMSTFSQIEIESYQPLE